MKGARRRRRRRCLVFFCATTSVRYRRNGAPSHSTRDLRARLFRRWPVGHAASLCASSATKQQKGNGPFFSSLFSLIRRPVSLFFFLRPSRRGLSPTAAPPSFRSSEDVAGCISTQEERSADQAMSSSSLVRSARPGRFAGKTRRWLRPVGRPRPGGHSSIFALLASICRPIQLTSLDGQHTHTPSLLMSVAALGGVDRGGNERARSSYRSNEDLLFGVATLATPAPSMLLLPPLSTIWPGPLFFSSSAGAPCLVGRRVANPCSLGD